MQFTYLLVRFFPYWALPVALILAELGRHFRRRAKKAQVHAFGMAGLLVLLTILWFVFRGDLNSDAWVRQVIGTY